MGFAPLSARSLTPGRPVAAIARGDHGFHREIGLVRPNRSEASGPLARLMDALAMAEPS